MLTSEPKCPFSGPAVLGYLQGQNIHRFLMLILTAILLFLAIAFGKASSEIKVGNNTSIIIDGSSLNLD